MQNSVTDVKSEVFHHHAEHQLRKEQMWCRHALNRSWGEVLGPSQVHRKCDEGIGNKAVQEVQEERAAEQLTPLCCRHRFPGPFLVGGASNAVFLKDSELA